MSENCSSQEQAFTIHKDSKIEFKISHLGVLTVKGKFKEYSGQFVFEKNQLKNVVATVTVVSIDTKDKSRDKTLVSKAYLDAKKYPNIQFKSISINKNVLEGILTIKNVSKKIQIPFNMSFSNDKKEIELKLKTKIKRKDFKLHFGSMNALIGNTISIDLILIGKMK